MSRRPIYSPLACPSCKVAALRRQAGDPSWRCGACKAETIVEREDGAMIVAMYDGEAVLLVEEIETQEGRRVLVEVETQVWADLMVEEDAAGLTTWRGVIDNKLRTVTRDLGGSRGVLRLPDGREGTVFVGQARLLVNHPVEWPVQGDGPAPFGKEERTERTG